MTDLATVEAGLTAMMNLYIAKGLMAYPDLATTKDLQNLLLASLTLANTVDNLIESLRDNMLVFLILATTRNLLIRSLGKAMVVPSALNFKATVVDGDQSKNL